jgi:sRNA-binding regulator protein Hfq
MSEQPIFTPRKPFLKKPVAPKGHEAFLKALEQAGATVSVQMNSGEVLKGTIKAADKFTISLKVTLDDGGYQVYVINKHAYEMFWTNPADKVTD